MPAERVQYEQLCNDTPIVVQALQRVECVSLLVCVNRTAAAAAVLRCAVRACRRWCCCTPHVLLSLWRAKAPLHTA
jgi:hypothetical protein